MKKTQIVDGYEVRYDSDWIKHLETKAHWGYYWHQTNLINKYVTNDNGMIEIGVGTSFLCNYLRSKEKTIHTIDIDKEKSPDYVVSASEFDYSSLNASTVLAFEIFEHIPYSTFEKTIDKISKSQINKIIFSVPVAKQPVFSAILKLPKAKELNVRINIPRYKIKTDNHFWELAFIGGKKVVNEDKLLMPEKELIDLFNKKSFSLKCVEKVNNINFYLATKYS